MSKYLKSKIGTLIIELGAMDDSGDFCGTVVASNSVGYKIGDKNNYYNSQEFEPYTPTPQELIEWNEIMLSATSDNPNKVEVDDKDVNLRLECLKLTVASNIGLLTDMGDITKEANVAYNWIKTNNQ